MRRVTVNRWWSCLFGRGNSSRRSMTSESGAPSLTSGASRVACRGDAGPGIRVDVLRLMVLSRTYRQGRSAEPALLEMDPGNVLLGRRDLRRLSGEAIRDAMLVASGRLVARPFGPPVEPPQPPGVFAFTQTKKSWKSPPKVVTVDPSTPGSGARRPFRSSERSMRRPGCELRSKDDDSHATSGARPGERSSGDGAGA